MTESECLKQVETLKRSGLYKSGDSFTVSDAVRVFKSDTEYGQRVLDWMVAHGDLVAAPKHGFMNYFRARDIPRMRRARFCDYDPPMSASMAHVNRWLQSSLGWPNV